jgi:hypothetical protein
VNSAYSELNKNEEKRTLLIPEIRKIEVTRTLFIGKIEAKRTLNIKKLKKMEGKMNTISSRLCRIKEKRTGLFLNFAGSKQNVRTCLKPGKIEEKTIRLPLWLLIFVQSS